MVHSNRLLSRAAITSTEPPLLDEARIPVFIKKRDLLDINGVDLFFEQLKTRIAANVGGSGGVE
jgi:hypothetical protein